MSVALGNVLKGNEGKNGVENFIHKDFSFDSYAVNNDDSKIIRIVNENREMKLVSRCKFSGIVWLVRSNIVNNALKRIDL